ncbi:MAG: tRNA guanosine(15) transglycosylase TgtA [Candidatus Aenigmatarchaeota archaeon]|nr:MAG: tRNA guanosine(15) transglycosylase TgtA [Candidatus Aenigmarchaeota archaeon]
MPFEIIAKDAAARLGKWDTPRGTLETPNIAIVMNPNISLIKPHEIAKLGFSLLITNSYIIMRSPRREEVLQKGIHKFLGWEGPIYTDSGAFQMYSQGVGTIDPKETFTFQQDIGSNIITPLDVFTLPVDDHASAKRKMLETEKRYKALARKEGTLTVGPIQGGRFPDLRTRASTLTAKHDFDIHAIGGIVPYMERYEYARLADIIATCKAALPHNKPVHAFGAGHPMSFALLAALGCDLFDSAMYALAARRGGYLTVNGTLELGTLKEFPCACSVCATHTPQELYKMNEVDRERTLALHNLHVTAAEMRLVRQAIREQWLWELVAQRVRAHPKLLEGLLYVLKKHKEYFQKLEPVSKKSAFFYTGEESAYRPETVRVQEHVKRVRGSRYVTKAPFGRVPIELLGIYPIGQSITLEQAKGQADPVKAARAVIDYCYAKGANRVFRRVRVDVSGKTGRIRRVYDGDVMVGTIRAGDGLFVPTFEGAKALHKRVRAPEKRVYVNKDAVPFALQGRSVFCKFVTRCENVRAGEEVFVVDKKDRLLSCGTALLSAEEISDSDRGVAVSIRHTSETEE